MKKIGQFYREKILSLPENLRIKRVIPINPNKIKIEKDLFGWKIIMDNEIIECNSEEEARYIQVFTDIGMDEIFVPKDLEYLKQILPELEELKRKTEEIIEMNLDGIRDPRIRAKVRYEVYLEITK
ncbi:MAG: hypothetical protein WHS65_09780 [Melioribacteraceae bacterium]